MRPAAGWQCRIHVIRASGNRRREMGEARKPLAASLPREELNRAKCRLHDRFRLDVPADVEGWGAKEELRFERISSPREC